MLRRANATWWGTLKHGNGEIGTESGALESTPYSFKTRFEEERGTNPEELIGAAHAGCFSMALSLQLEQAGIEVERIDTEARVTLEKVDGGFGITGIHLVTRVEAPGADPEAVQEAAEGAKAGCPVSKALAATEITLEATLVN
ncbi:MAG: OsmC family protein [Gemmatimonadota bacterium]